MKTCFDNFFKTIQVQHLFPDISNAKIGYYINQKFMTILTVNHHQNICHYYIEKKFYLYQNH